MARIDNLANFLEDVATKIRSKTGSQSTITPANYDTEIEKIKVIAPRITFGALSSSGSVTASDTTTTSLDLRNLDTSNFTNMDLMFNKLTVLTTLNISNFDTSNVTSMKSMFSSCSALTSIDVSSFDTSKVTTFNSMFSGCSNLETITFGNNFTFEAISGTTGLSGVFNNCPKLDNNTLNQILHICTTVGSDYTGTKTLAYLRILSSFDNFDNIPNLSNYQEFIDAGWTIAGE